MVTCMNNKIIKILCIVLAVVFVIGGIIISSSINFKDTKTDNISNSINTGRVLKDVRSEHIARLSDKSVISNAKGNIYYVDAAASEGNDGLSPEKALKTIEQVNSLKLMPGDMVLFKRNCVWNGGLFISNSGSEDAPIIYDAYGEGQNMPRINGNGIVTNTVYGLDASWIELRNLEITNHTEEVKVVRGIFFTAMETDVEGIKIKGCYVHDVNADPIKPSEEFLPWQDEHWNGGIVVRSGGTPESRRDIKLDNVIIEGNLIEECCLTGISAGSTMVNEYPKTTNLKILNNYVANCFGDGIIAFFTDGALIEGNVSDHNGTANDPNAYYAGIWVIGADNTVMQYNEAFGQGISGDGQGFDVDLQCHNSLVQYNYSHDNYGGFLLLMEQNSGKVTVRYNVSVNDGGSFIQVSRRENPTSSIQADIYNNTFFTSSTNFSKLFYLTNDYVSNRIYGKVRNNIFCYVGESNPEVFTDAQFYKNFDFENNCYYGFATRTLPENEEGQIVEDPLFKYPGAVGNGLNNVTYYQLLSNSPCLNSGIKIHNNGGLDFWGNTLKTDNNIGAYDGKSVKKDINANIALLQPTHMSSIDGIKMLHIGIKAKLTDGDTVDVARTKPADSADSKEWFEVDLGEEYDIGKVILYAGEDPLLFPSDFTISVYDGNKWNKVAEEKNYKVKDASEKQIFEIKNAKGNKIRIDITKMRSNEDGEYVAELSEIEVFQEEK